MPPPCPYRPEPDPAAAALADAYARCRDINRQHGRSYYLATRLLQPDKRPHVHALYGFTRWADEIVDSVAEGSPEDRARRLKEWAETFRLGLAGGEVSDPLLPAVLNTVRTYNLDLGDFEQFLRSMAMDLGVTTYPTYDDLLGYMSGSAAAIGTMMLPILGLADGADPVIARGSARQLGIAFQLTNFIRDVGEDLDRGRIYLPAEDLAAFGVTPEHLANDAVLEETSEPVRRLVAYECRRALGHYATALPGLAMLEPRSQACIRAAYLLYGGILDEIARSGFDVLRTRATVPRRRRALLMAAALSATTFAARVRRWRVPGAPLARGIAP